MAYVAVTLLLIFGAKAWGQQRMADSLLLVLEKYRREDTIMVNRMNDLAYEHHKLYKQFNDSTFNAKNVKRMADLESAYRFDKERQFFEAEQQKNP